MTSRMRFNKQFLNEFSKPLLFEPLEIYTALLAKGRISTNFTLITSLLHSTALLQSLHVHRCEISARKPRNTTGEDNKSELYTEEKQLNEN